MKNPISFTEAYALTIENIQPLPAELVPLLQTVDRTPAQDLLALVDSPSANVSLKDGFAVKAADIAGASPETPVRLALAGTSAAGGGWRGVLKSGQTVRMLTGAPLPDGAESVLAEEYTRVEAETVLALRNAEPGRNILYRGSDVRCGDVLARHGERLRPTTVGLLAAGGHGQIDVVRQPRVHILATGDEVVAPGEPLGEGKLYASNLVTLAAWCKRYGFAVHTAIAPDEAEPLRNALLEHLELGDALLTSGGAWSGERDLTVRLLDELGWKKFYHRVRIGPGKAVGFGVFAGKPVFCLPGGPPSNHMAFIQLALPGLLRLAGWTKPGLPLRLAHLEKTVQGQVDWTQYIHGRLEKDESNLRFHPILDASRLQMMAETQAVLAIPEGVEEIKAGTMVWVQDLQSG